MPYKSKLRRRKFHAKYQKERPEKFWESHIRHVFNLTPKAYFEMLTAQENTCAICRKPEKAIRNGKIMRLGVDHNHNTGSVRGLLCTDCNRALGMFQDSILVLESAIAYLKKHSE